MNGKEESLSRPRDEKGERLSESLVFFTILMYNALIGVFTALAYTFGDIQSAVFLAVVGTLVFVGLISQMVFGLFSFLRFFYGLTGSAVFLYAVARGGQDESGLFGALGLIIGFVIVLGWHVASWFLAVLALLAGLIFYEDIYLNNAQPYLRTIEWKFLVTYFGMALLALGYGYAYETRVERLQAFGKKMSSLAFKDEMTNLPNRRSSEELLSQRWEEYKRMDVRFAVLLCNIDGLKDLNSQYGTGFGDGVIARVTNVLLRGLRSQDIVSRWGGDEFLVILPGQDGQTALKVAERVRGRVEHVEFVMRGKLVQVTISVGAASVENALSASDLVSIAESGLYQAKHTGKNRVMMG